MYEQYFCFCQEGIVDTGAASREEAKKTELDLAREVAIGRRDNVDDKSKRKLKDYLKSNFWVPDMTPDAAKKKTEKPPDRPLSPCTQRPLKVSGIFSINLVKDEAGSDGPRDVKYTCPVSLKQITHQKVVAIRSTGTVMLKECYDNFVKKDLSDPVTGKTFVEKDVIQLTAGGTGFSGHEDSQSKGTYYRPNMGGC